MVEERKRYILEFPDIPKDRQEPQAIPVEDRVANFNEVDLGFGEDVAVEEAGRCLSCRRCLGCALCLAECEKGAIDFEQADEMLDISVDTVIITPSEQRVYIPLPERFGHGSYVNVITDVEFERILSDKGPYSGLLIRPFDGEIPTRLGFICWDHDNEQGGKRSVDSLSYAMEEVVLARKRVEGLEIALFFPDKDEYVQELEKNEDKVQGMSLRKGEVTGVSEVQESKNLTVRWGRNGEVEEEEFEMIVVSTIPEIPNYIKKLAAKLNVDMGGLRANTSLTETSRKGVFLSGIV